MHCQTATFRFLFYWKRCFIFSIFSFGNDKKLASTNSPKPKPWKNKQKISKKPQCIPSSESNTICSRVNFFEISFTSGMLCKKVLQFTSFQIMMYYLNVFPSPCITGVFIRGLFGRILKRICIWGFIVQKMSVSYAQCLCPLVYASNIESWCFKIETLRKRAFFRYREN